MRNRNQAYFDKVKALERMRVIARLLKNNEITEEEAVSMIEADDHFYKTIVEKEYIYAPPTYQPYSSGTTWTIPNTGSSTVTYTSTGVDVTTKKYTGYTKKT